MRKISYISSSCVNYDGISNAIRTEIASIIEGRYADVKLYTEKCDYRWIPSLEVASPAAIAADGFYNESGLQIYHFGIYHPVFELLTTPRGNAKRIVVFHNITPEELARTEAERQTIRRSFQQLKYLSMVDHVICCSEENLRVLRKAGINVKASVVSLAFDGDPAPDEKPSFMDNVLRIVFLGRYVQSKGPDDLLLALGQLPKNIPCDSLEINMIGNEKFSDTEMLAALNVLGKKLTCYRGLNIQINIHKSIEEKKKKEILAASDIMVLPSYHEGFCIPILEAFSSGCRVIAYDNSNIPSISSRYAVLVETGDISGLAKAIETMIRELSADEWRVGGTSGYSRYKNDTGEYLKQYSLEAVGRKMHGIIESLLLY